LTNKTHAPLIINRKQERFDGLTVMTRQNRIKLLTELLDIEGIKVILHRQHEGMAMTF
jgi:hypothetical protein